MTNEEMRLAIAKAKGYELGYSYELYAEVKLGDPVPEVDKHLKYLYTDSEYSNGSPMWIETPDWPTSIADAWELAEEAHLTIYTPGSSYASGEYGNGDSYAAETQNGLFIEADTAPRAICEAWLEWKAAK